MSAKSHPSKQIPLGTGAVEKLGHICFFHIYSARSASVSQNTYFVRCQHRVRFENGGVLSIRRVIVYQVKNPPLPSPPLQSCLGREI